MAKIMNSRKSYCYADHDKPIAVAGVMGGENSEIDDTTSVINFGIS